MELSARLGMPPRETKVVGLICAGHFFSHFHMLLVPSLFPVLREVYGVGFTELGFAVACFSVASSCAFCARLRLVSQGNQLALLSMPLLA